LSDFGLDPDADSGFVEKKKNRKKKASVSPTQRSLKQLRDRGYLVWITEHYNAFTQRRHDLYNFIDIVGLNIEEVGILGIQTTTLGGLNARIKKAEELESYWMWLACGNDVEFHGWRFLKTSGIWEPKIVKVSYRDLF